MGEQENTRHPRRRGAAAAAFVGLSATAGVLVSAMVAPVVAVAGVATETGIHLFETMPEALTVDALAQTSDIYAKNREGQPVLLASVYDQNRKNVAWEDISPFVKDALTSTEDPRFYTHGGVDIPSALRAAIGNASSGNVDSGASTITMQYVKNILVQRAEAIRDKGERAAAYKEATKTGMDRKLREMRLAIGLEKALPKDQIMLGYLNIAHFGGSVYGIEAAAEYYFGVTAADLTLPQAAALVATVNAPNDFRIDDPDNIGDNKFRRDNDVLAAMLEEKRITQAQHDEAVATPIEPKITPPSTGCVTANPLGAGFFCDYVQRVIENEKLLPDPTDPERSTLKRGGYDIYTTLDLDLQASAVAAVEAYVPRTTEVLDLGSSLVTVEPGTGRILAMAQNKDFNADQDEASPENTAVNYSTDRDYGGSSGFQAGSTYKVFTLAEWLKDGRSLNDVVNGDSRAFNLSSFKDSCQGSSSGPYSPKNDSGQKPGNISVRSATANSVNGAYFSMAQKLDQCEIRKTAEAFGVKRADGKPLTSYVSDVLGTNEVSPLRMAAAFAGIANKGVYCAPAAIDRIVGPDGAEVPVPASSCSEAVSPEVAATMASALQSVTRGGGTGAPSNPGDGIPVFGKTGTTDSEKDTWFVGSTTRLTTAVWVGNVTGGVSLRRSTVGGIQADQLRHRVWKQYMTAANKVHPGEDFPEASVRPVRE
ncbi:transglycosylase domain-containing protein [Leifsonia sp. EB34]|uniref:transglycosylase domain-containing protein n=1 Tax=Leifsonia sp. EB34 TaxID=3156303 RepID=UPI003512D495